MQFSYIQKGDTPGPWLVGSVSKIEITPGPMIVYRLIFEGENTADLIVRNPLKVAIWDSRSTVT